MGETTTRSAEFAAELESLEAINTFFTQAAHEAHFDARAVYAVQMAVEEACSNIIEYAYADQTDGVIRCSYTAQAGQLHIVLCDYGCAFDPTALTMPDLTVCLEEREVGGLGVYFIHQLMDEVRFECAPDGANVLTMVKRM